MSYTQFGYSTYAASTPLLAVSGGSSSSQPTCYERTGVSPESQYDGRLYPRLPYATPYQPPDAPDPAATPFYAPALNSTYGMKESSDPWRSISQSASYYYDPTLAAYGYGGLDFNGARRKNVTRDSTSTLKAWLNEHRKNPYPTKGEKIMLAIITKMTLTQVSTWFANARRRLKKENKMTWEPRNKAEAHDDDAKRGDDGAKDEDDDSGPYRDDEKPLRNSMHPTELELGSHHQRNEAASFRPSIDHAHSQHHAHHPPPPPPQLQSAFDDAHHQAELLSAAASLETSHSSSPDLDPSYIMRGGGSKDPFDPYKPKIWSLADTATANKQQLLLSHAHPTDLGAWSAAPSGLGRSYGGCGGFGPISSLQTDTPPQTPPNMKVGSAHHHAAVVPSAYLDSHRTVYMGQAPTMCQSEAAMGEAQMQEDKLESYSSAHGSQSSTSNQNAANECISEDYDYSASSVR